MEKEMQKDTCKFYDKEKKNCKALNDLYCVKERKPCSFHKKRGEK